jgi:hypothetical protein
MFNLFEMLQKAQGGQPAEMLARQFGLSPGQAQSAIDALLPAFTLAFQNIMKNPQSWPAVMAMMTGAGGNPFIPTGLQPDPLKAFFGPGDLSERIAAQAAAVSGVNAQILQQMMPVMASTLMGGFARDMAQGGFGALFGQAGAQPGTMFPGVPDNWGELLGQMMQAGFPAAPQPKAAPGGEAGAMPNPFDPAAYVALMQRMMGQPAPEPEEPAAPAEPPPTPSDLGLDAVTSFVETGREVQEQHMRALQELFEKVSEKKPE